MNLLITGSNGFLGKNLIAELKNRGYSSILEYSRDSKPDDLNEYCRVADFVFHLAGINRPVNPEEFKIGNTDLTMELVNQLKTNGKNCPIIFSSSIQAEMDNDYGRSKLEAENIVLKYINEMNTKSVIYRFPNIFGKWSKPNYNSAIATFCHNIANDLEIKVDDPEKILTLVYIDDVVEELINTMENISNINENYLDITTKHRLKLGEIVEKINSFKINRSTNYLPLLSDDFTKKLYSTYLSFLPEDNFSYKLHSNVDNRGSFTEFIKTTERGQVSINISKPGITKGNHWHNTKNEKFLVVSGNGVIRFRKIGSSKVLEYYVSGDSLEVVDIPVGYTHNIENLGDSDMVTVMWANEIFNPQKPDTYFLEV